MYRTNTNGELTDKDIKKKAALAGWCHTRRDHGGIIFIDLRDRYGITQVVFDPEHNKEVHKSAEGLRREDVIAVEGIVRARPEGMTNTKLKTGKIEVLIDKIEIMAKSEVPPIEIHDRIIANDDTRLKYRFLDLRRPIMQKNLQLRHNAAMAAREHFNAKGFLEIETPLLVRATPEGARDYIVPSRVNAGKFYALPQSPQLYKQLLMISGVDRYFQFARCLRDEDLRADRQPEHTQMDFEMSFADEKDIMEFVEGLFKHLFKKVLNADIETPFPVLSYDESMSKYGTDKPDLRFGLEIKDVTDTAVKSDFGVFKDVANSGGKVKCINPETEMPRKEIDSLIDFATKAGAKGMAWMKVQGNKLESNIAKYFKPGVQEELIRITGAKSGVLLFIADGEKQANDLLGKIRLEIADRLKLRKEGWKFCWVTDYPLFEWDENEERWAPCHHIFTKPKEECIKFLEKDPAKVYANLFDVVLNGTELASGSMRITQPELQKQVMKVIGMTEQQAEEKFGFLLNAYKYAAPPHGGMGLGFDRTVALMSGTTDIREVIAFPKNKNAECPMDESPGTVTDEQLKDVHIKLDVLKKE